MALPTRSDNNNDLYQPLADINVTPLVDVMLVLLIIFMITAPLLAKGMKVNLPQARASVPVHDKKPIVVVVGKNGKVALGSEEVTLDALVDGVRAMMGDDPSKVVHLRGDLDASYGDVVAVMDRLGKNGIAHIAIMTKQAGAKDLAPVGGAAK